MTPSRASIDLSAIEGAAFDLDGVLTRTTGLHALAWKQLFDAFLAHRGAQGAGPFRPFDVATDYARHVDGKPRADGVRDFLASRGLVLPEGGDDDPAGADTVAALCRRKDAMFHAALAEHGVQAFDGSVAFLHALRSAGIRTALVSSSRNAAAILAAAGLRALFDVVVDGVEAARLGLRGKPAPDTFLFAARSLGVPPSNMLGVEDALAGVAAIRAAGYGLAIGMDRGGQAPALRAHGADLVVRGLDELLPAADADGSSTGWSRVAREVPVDALPLVPWPESPWIIDDNGTSPALEPALESLFAIGNGHLGARASFAGDGGACSPGTFVAGVFDAGPDGRVAIACLPDWAGVRLPADDGRKMESAPGRVVARHRFLDLRQGALFLAWRHEDASGRAISLREVRLAAAGDRRLLLQSVAWSAEQGRDPPLPATDATALRTRDGTLVVPAASMRLAAQRDGASGAATRPPGPDDAAPRQAGRFDRVVAIHTTREEGDPVASAPRHAAQALQAGIEGLVEGHRRAWEQNWIACDLRIDGDPDVQRAVRFAIYHLLSAADPGDDRVSIGARGLTGRGYAGHVFWDTELYMLPFFILTRPQTARTLLAYRHRTLPAARRRAASLGQTGALFAWESADTGDDVTPPFVPSASGDPIRVLTGQQEIHVSADVAFATWHYWRATGDDGFLLDAGAEILLETARYWASRATPGADGRYHLEGVIGPDEYHEAVDDNAYTNAMAQWNLRAGVRVADLLRRRWPARWARLSARVGFAPEEAARWRGIARAMYGGPDPATGLIEQFRGYFDLEHVDLRAAGRDGLAGLPAGRERLQRSQVIKQPDVLMLMHLFWDAWPPAVREANFRYYEPRCAHGSSLSPAIHALLAARLGDLPLAMRHLRAAMDIDLAPGSTRAAGGVHLGALGGLWQAVVFGFGGLHFRGGTPAWSPRLPAHWRGLALDIAWRGRRHAMATSPAGAVTGETSEGARPAQGHARP